MGQVLANEIASLNRLVALHTLDLSTVGYLDTET